MRQSTRRYFIALLVALLPATGAFSQYYLTTTNFSVTPDSTCTDPYLNVSTNAYTPGLNLRTYFGDGTNGTVTVVSSGTGGYAYVPHTYASPGIYTAKHVLLNGTARVDSMIQKIEYKYCQTFTIRCYHDVNGNNVYDSATEGLSQLPIKFEVSKAGVPIDTFTSISGFYYTVVGFPGEVYKFRVLQTPTGAAISAPASGIIYDTIQFMVNQHMVKYMGMTCVAGAAANVGVYGSVRAGRHSYISDIMVTNASCTPQNVTLVMRANTKYGSTPIQVIPTPTSIVGNTLTWNLTGVSLLSAAHIEVHYEQSPWLLVGDTVHTKFMLMACAGDTVHNNDTLVDLDTVTSSFDPNDKAVSPSGYIAAGTKLTYTLRFENTGNDTALNIHIQDTLSDNVDVKSLEMIASSHKMMLTIQDYGTHKVVRFDFPDINLLDSTHHGLCDGFVTFTINARAGLANGTLIPNRAGIYFDYNDVVMTNTITDIIGIPSGVKEMSNVAPVMPYPNPAHNQLTIDADNNSYQTITITNLMGQQLMTHAVNAAHTTLDVSTLPQGLYVLTLKGEGGTQVSKFEKL